jgi:hypothetical protein
MGKHAATGETVNRSANKPASRHCRDRRGRRAKSAATGSDHPGVDWKQLWFLARFGM